MSGQEISLPFVLGKLLNLGYIKGKRIATTGRFSLIGDLLKIWPYSYNEPISINLWGNSIESIKLGQARLEEVKIFPYKLKPGKSSLKDYLELNPNVKIILSSSIKTIPDWLKKYVHLEFKPFVKKNQTFFTPAPSLYRKDFVALKNDLKKYGSLGYRIIISTSKPETVNHHLDDVKEKYTLAPFKIKLGWMSRNKTLVITDLEIFGSQKQKLRAKRFKYDPNFIAELNPGDYVVHADHGIGVFKKMTQNVLANTTKEYFTLLYKAGDKLYLPVDQADKISRYIGSPNPTLHRLGGSSWLSLKSKAKQSTVKLARELIKLYAERKLQSGFGFSANIENLEKNLADNFVFTETEDQTKVIQEVLEDMSKTKPMDRLVCGDVGFGKTEVAIRACFRAVLHNKQVAVLAPTTILSEQHYKTFKNRLSNQGIKISVVNRFKSHSKQKQIISKFNQGEIDIIIGTHRLLSKDVKPQNLGLLILDEEQRFGVAHKETLKKLKTNVDVLTLSATPIPRTLHMSLSGIRDISTIKTAPIGRKPVKTKIIPYKESIIKQAILKELNRGGQVYFLHNRVATISAIANHWQKLLPEINIDIAHGQMTEEGLYQVMKDFNNKKIDMLICSSIIESGLDFPNVNTLIVDNAIYFGLASLYQLRGRIGRAKRQGYAYFCYKTKNLTPKAEARLQVLEQAKNLGDGFEVALKDLELRGAGNLLGGQQSGNIVNIGLYLYNRLLKQTIKEIQTGKIEKPKLDVKIELPLTIGLPKKYIGKETNRLKLYQKTAELDNEEIPSFKKWLEAKYGKLPKETNNLLDIISLKNLAAEAGINKISRGPVFGQEQINFDFAKSMKLSRIRKLLDYNPNWIIKDRSIKINTTDLSVEWLAEINHSLKILQ